MKILIVDNGTSYLEKLKDLLVGHHLEVQEFGEVDLGRAGGFDFIILSGGHEFPVMGNENKFEKEIELILAGDIPMLGICLGFEIIAHTFGASLRLQENREKGFVDIYPVISSPLFRGINHFQVYESHRWVVDSVPDELIEIGRSDDGIEMIQHRDAPIFGFQFHPEMFVDETVGGDIFRNLVTEIEKM